MKLQFNTDHKAYVFECEYEERFTASDAKFDWNKIVPNKWATRNPSVAAKLIAYAVPSVRRMLEEQKHKRERSLVMSRASDLDIDLPRPEGLAYRGYQKVGIQWASEREGSLIGDDMGLGKTVQAIGVINNNPSINRVLIVCTKSTKLNWKLELERWLTRPLSVGVVESSLVPDADILVCNYDILYRFDFAEYEWDLVVADEVHKCKNASTRRSQSMYSIKGKQRIGLTGTPIPNKIIELYPIIQWLDPDTWGNEWAFKQRYCGATQETKPVWNQKKKKYEQKQVWNFTGASNLPELQEKLRSTIMVRRLKAEVEKDLPPKQRKLVVVPANGSGPLIRQELSLYEKHQQMIEEAKAERDLAQVSGNRNEYNLAVAKLREKTGVMMRDMSKLRAETALALAPKVVEHVLDVLADNPGHKIILFAHHKEVITLLKKELAAYNPVSITGETSTSARQEAKEKFQTDPKVQVFIGNIQAAGEGITLTASAHVVFAELDWVPANVKQAEDRAHRIGQQRMVLVEHIVMDGSLGAKMAKTIIAKQEIIDQALDGDIDPNELVTPEDEPSVVKRVAKQVTELTRQQVSAVREALQILAGDDTDYARSKNGVGFSRYDARVGHDLAQYPALTDGQAQLGYRIVSKYHKQLPQRIKETLHL